ncbi:IS701 family transposase [Rhodopila sp.]|uniref:IS701 family transposase n=1 Tax=Rhodopila sp. TaxID=2480087 RepID=UPI003D0C8CAA
MLCLPPRFAAIILAFAPVFVQHRTWRHAQLLWLGAMLAPGRRTVSSLLRIIGLRRERHFVNYHRVLNRAVWNSRHGARLLLGLLINRFVSHGPIVLGVDDTIERRRGKRISAKGIYRDPVRSSKSFFVKTSGLRWLSLMVLAPVPWAQRVWGLPFLTVLAPSERFCRTHNQRHKKLTDWTRQVAVQARRWLPKRTIVLVGDSSFAALDLLGALTRQSLICITRLRLDAALYAPAPPREAGAKGRPRKKGARLPTLTQRLQDPNTKWQSISVSGWYGNTERCLEVCSDSAVWYHAGQPVLPIRWVMLRDPDGAFEPQALLCTDPARDPYAIIGWFVRRWALEVTFRETRDHLGVETQRQWSDQAIARTTPCLLALFSIVTLLGTRLTKRARLVVSTAAWYRKQRPTFADTLAAVRREIWAAQGFSMSRSRVDSQKLSKALREGMTYALCNAA